MAFIFLQHGNKYARSFLHLFSWAPSFKNIPLNVPVSNPVPLERLKQGIQEKAGNCKRFRNPLFQNRIYLQPCVLSVRAGAGEGSMLGSSNPKLVVNLSLVIPN